MNWQRARTPENIEERRASIVAAAQKLFKTNSYEDISLNSIAAEAGTAKSNVYRYFQTREEIFMTIYISLLLDWSAEIVEIYKSSSKKTTPHEMGRKFAQTTGTHQDMLQLSSFIFISIEKNSSSEQLAEFKKISLQICKDHHKELNRIFPGLSLEDVIFFLKMLYAAMSMLWAAERPNKELKKLLNNKDFKQLAHNFQLELTMSFEIYLQGLLSRKQVKG